MELTREQKLAVEAPEDEVVCIAGAGAGKTRVLTQRANWLIDQGAAPSSLFIATFTRKAAAEMAQRLQKRNLFVGTFHSLALQILTTHAPLVGYDPNELTVVNDKDAEALCCDIMEDLGYDKQATEKEIKTYLELYYTGRPPKKGKKKILSRIANEYWVRLRSQNTVDYGLIQTLCLKLLQMPKVIAGYHDQIEHVLVDEFQDIDAVQYDIVKCLSPPATFFAVGDPRQSIYSFRGARPDLVSAGTNGKVYHLTKCYRCGSDIVDAANSLISCNKSHDTTPLIDNGDYSNVERVEGGYWDVVSEIKRLTSSGYALDDIAVLSRTWWAIDKLQSHLEGEGIDSFIAGQKTEESFVFTQVYAALRLSVNPKDEIAARILRWSLGIGDTWDHAKEIAASQGKRILDVCDGEFAEGLRSGRPLTMLAKHFPQNQEEIGYWLNLPGATIQDKILWHATKETENITTPPNHITLSTIHAAKGLEWPCVIMLDVNERQLPHSRARTKEDIEEERRVAYVAVTRAQECLVVHSYKEPSSFIDEMNLT